MESSDQLPRVSRHLGTKRLYVGCKPVLLLAGELHNSSSSNLDYMASKVWPRVEALGCNAILAPITWELVEPQEGEFDFRLVDGLIAQARERSTYLVPLWFGAYKNALSNYVPSWVKVDLDRFPRAKPSPDARAEAITVFSKELLAAEKQAYRAFMRRVRELDPLGQIVIVVQVENEVGLLRSWPDKNLHLSRDYCAQANDAFVEEVPAELMRYLSSNLDSLQPALRSLWAQQGMKERGTWPDLFGTGPASDEVFMAWHFASYVGAIAQVGIDEHPIPAFANAWIVQDGTQEPGAYPNGGPVAHMIDVWRAAAPSLSFLAPDIYLPDFAAECRRYADSDNALFIPEMKNDFTAAANALYAIGEHGAICVSPFGIDSMDVTGIGNTEYGNQTLGNPVAETVIGVRKSGAISAVTPGLLLRNTYRLLSDMVPILLNTDQTKIRGILEDVTVASSADSIIDLGGYRMIIEWDNANKAREGRECSPVCGGGIIINSAPGEFYIVGFGFQIRFSKLDDPCSAVEYLALDEGDFDNGNWISGRRLNGDEYYLRLPLDDSGMPKVRRVRPYAYPKLSSGN